MKRVLSLILLAGSQAIAGCFSATLMTLPATPTIVVSDDFPSNAWLYTPLVWKYARDVGYSALHDVNMIWVSDGPNISRIHVKFGDLSWEEVDEWKPGRKLGIVYTPEQGLWLVDDVSQKKVKILNGLEKHPIDMMLEKYRDGEEGRTTLGMVKCHVEARDQWDKEMGRAYRTVLATLPDDRKAKLIAAQRRWLAFRDVEEEAISALYDCEGSMWSIVIAGHYMELTRERALRLMSYMKWDDIAVIRAAGVAENPAAP